LNINYWLMNHHESSDKSFKYYRPNIKADLNDQIRRQIMRNLLLSIFCIGLFFFLFENGYSASVEQDLGRKQIHELERQCKQDAEEYSRKVGRDEFIKGPNDKIIESVDTVFSYIYHYNSKRDKCYILTTTSKLYKRRKEQRFGNLMYLLLCDVNKQYCFGSYGERSIGIKTKDVIDCNVADVKCKTKKEWLKLVKPYMEE
jgi:hypothetical protein